MSSNWHNKRRYWFLCHLWIRNPLCGGSSFTCSIDVGREPSGNFTISLIIYKGNVQKYNYEKRRIKIGIHIVKAQTGLGKTSNYINYLQKADKSCIIAVPTHNLKDEMFCKAVNSGVKDIFRTPSIPESSISPEIIKKVNHYIYSEVYEKNNSQSQIKSGNCFCLHISKIVIW